MHSVDQANNAGLNALRKAVIKVLTGNTDEEALLKEHFDSLIELTNISKKTLKRFFKDKAQIGPQTRNLLAAVALGRSNELEIMTSENQTYYLEFLSTVKTLRGELQSADSYTSIPTSVWQFSQILAKCYEDQIDDQEFIPIHCVRLNIEQGARVADNLKQEIELEAILSTRHSQVILTGEAGSGKTTYAQHICSSWTKSQDLERDIPIYIDLNSQKFDKQALGICSYLLNHYFEPGHDWMVLDFLESNVGRYYFILDGFDHLTTKGKSALLDDLYTYSPHVHYLILSRPYGFQDFAYPTRSLYQLCGFKLDSQETFVKKCLSEFGNDLDHTSLMTYIHSREILTSLSRSPMHLYRLVRLAARTKSFNLLQGIGSELELQQLFNKYVD